MTERRLVSAPFSYLFVPGNRPERFDKAFAAAAESAAGAVQVHAKMVDRPVVLRARSILDHAPR